MGLLAACTIVVAVTGGHNPANIVKHEMAHCWGWKHPEQAAPREGQDYRPFKVPLFYRLLGNYPQRLVIIHSETEHDAMRLCGGHWGCMWKD